jgi:hypothetical protein
MFIPFGVEMMITLVDLPDEIVGYTEEKNCSAMLFGMNANSSRKMMLKEFPLTALEEVEAAMILDPFSSSTEPLFHDMTPCCIHLGRFS